jgi:hypothetical protein
LTFAEVNAQGDERLLMRLRFHRGFAAYFVFEKTGPGSQGFTLGYSRFLPTGGWFERGCAARLISRKVVGGLWHD